MTIDAQPNVRVPRSLRRNESRLTALNFCCSSPLARASEAELKIPDLRAVSFFGIDGWTLLATGFAVCIVGLAFGFFQYLSLKKMPVHRSMREISELIYETCKTYLITQGKFILILEAFIGVFYMALVVSRLIGLIAAKRERATQEIKRVPRP